MILVILRIVSYILRLFLSILESILLCTVGVENYTEGPPSSCRNMLLLSAKEIFHLIDDVVGFLVSPKAGGGNLTYHLCVSLVSLLKNLCLRCVSLRQDSITLLNLILPQNKPMNSCSKASWLH